MKKKTKVLLASFAVGAVCGGAAVAYCKREEIKKLAKQLYEKAKKDEEETTVYVANFTDDGRLKSEEDIEENLFEDDENKDVSEEEVSDDDFSKEEGTDEDDDEETLESVEDVEAIASDIEINE